MSNINDKFFDGQYKDIWKAMIPPAFTEKEVEFMVSYFNLNSNSRVFDMMCGYGRHAIGLARKGIAVEAIDNLADYIDEIKDIANKENLQITTIKTDAVTHVAQEPFDLAICMGNSLNFYNRYDVQTILNHVSSQLKPGGHLLINSWSIAEIADRTFKEHSAGKIGDVSIESRSTRLSNPERIEMVTQMTNSMGQMEEKKAVDYIYSIPELGSLLQAAGMRISETYSIPPKKKFEEGDMRIYLIAELM